MSQRSGTFALKLYQQINAIRNMSFRICSGFYFNLVLALLFIPLRWLLAWLFAAMVHELGHIFVILWSGHRIGGVVLKGTGAEICTDALGSDEWFCAMAGPIAGLLLVMLSRYFPMIGICAFFQTAVNLIPVPPLDGGRILKGLLCFLLNERHAEVCVQLLGILMIAVVMLLFRKYNEMNSLHVVIAVCIIVLLKILQIKIPCKRRNKWVQ